MGVRGGLEDAGSWLVGDTELNPAWLQQAHTAITPQEWFTISNVPTRNIIYNAQFLPVRTSSQTKGIFFFCIFL